MRFRKSAHAIYKAEYHLFWIPRYRRKNTLQKDVKEYTEKIILHIPELCPDIELVKLNVQGDHCSRGSRDASQNCSCRCNSVYQIQLAKKLKAKFPFMQKPCCTSKDIWSRGYCISCISLMNEKEILAYVEHQEKEDKKGLY